MSVAVDEETFWLGDWKVEPLLNRIVRDDEIVRIDPRNMRVLQLLASKPGQVFSQAEIEEGVWTDVVVTPNSVYQSIAQLRRALGDDRNEPRYIGTIARRGYRLVAPVGPASTRSDTCGTRPTDREHFSSVGKRSPEKATVVSGTQIARLCLAIVLAAVMLAMLPRYGADDSAPSQEQRAMERKTSASQDSKTESARELYNLGIVSSAQGQTEKAIDYYSRALEIERERVGSKHPSTGRVLSSLALAYVWDHNYHEAEASARAAVEAFEGESELHPDRVEAIHFLGYALLESGKYAEAEPYLSDALRLSRLVFGQSSMEGALVLEHLAILRFTQGRLIEAKALMRDVIALLERTTTDPLALNHATTSLVLILLELNQYKDAKQAIEHSLSMLYGAWNDDHPYVIATRDLLGKSLIGLGEHSAAEDIFRRNVDLWLQHGRVDRSLASASALGEALLGQGRIIDAEKYLTRASAKLNENVRGRLEKLWFREHQVRLRKLHAAKAERSSASEQVADVPSF